MYITFSLYCQHNVFEQLSLLFCAQFHIADSCSLLTVHLVLFYMFVPFFMKSKKHCQEHPPTLPYVKSFSGMYIQGWALS
jgi:hypothetical protein